MNDGISQGHSNIEIFDKRKLVQPSRLWNEMLSRLRTGLYLEMVVKIKKVLGRWEICFFYKMNENLIEWVNCFFISQQLTVFFLDQIQILSLFSIRLVPILRQLKLKILRLALEVWSPQTCVGASWYEGVRAIPHSSF